MNLDTKKIKLIVHIGSGKTGSTSIQQTLRVNTAFLDANKTHYLGLMFENSPVKKYEWQIPSGWFLLKKDPTNGFYQLAEILNETLIALKQNGVEKAIWSNESLMEQPSEIIPILKGLQNTGVDVCIVGYIRRHDAWARSAYVQWGIKHKTYSGKIKPFKEWFSADKANFNQYLQHWVKEVWNEISIRNFDVYPNVTKDFFDYIGLRGSYNNIRSNDTPSSISLYLWSIFNNQIEQPVLPAELYELLHDSNLLSNPIIDLEFDELFPSLEDLKKVQIDTEEDREKINSILQKMGQSPILQNELKEKGNLVTQTQINTALLQMLKHQNDELRAIKTTLKRYEANLGKLNPLLK